jgi:peptidyl-prolyl cis-trans isomerase B (cyclophilin B)
VPNSNAHARGRHKSGNLAAVLSSKTPPKLLFLALLVLALAAGGCGGGGEKKKAKTGTTTTATQASQKPCPEDGEPKVRRSKKRPAPSFRLARDKKYVATVVTSCGTFEIELAAKQAPRTGGSFVSLAREGFYDGLGFHRIVTGFVIQGGDPRGNGQGGPGYTIREPPPGDVVYSEGVVAMAKTATEAPGTSGSQFFIVTSDDAQLDPIYALLGQVTKGLDVVKRIELTPAGPDEKPVVPVVIKKITIRVS